MQTMNIVMGVLFILFMIFIFGGYHKTKSAAREEQFKREEEARLKEEKL